MTEKLKAEHSITEQMAVLFIGRMVALAITFATPLVLVRVFSPHDYGLYKQALLIHGTLIPLLTLGIPASLFYFLPRYPENKQTYIWQALWMISGLGLVGSLLLVVGKAHIARLLNNPSLETYIPYLALFVVLYVIPSILESLMIIFKHVNLSSVTVIASELLRATLVITAAVWKQSMIFVLLALVIWSASRLIALLVYLWSVETQLRLPQSQRLRDQLRYSIQFGAAVIIATMTDGLHQYAVSYVYNPAVFAIYAVACFQLPFVSIAFQSISEITLVRVTELRKAARLHEARRLIGDSVTKLFLLLVPLYGWLIVNARDFIVLLFTEQFERSVDIFRIFLTGIPIIAIGVDYVTQAFFATGFILRVNVLRLVVSGALLLVLLPVWGLEGAALSVVLAMAVMKVCMLFKVSNLLDVNISQVLPWGRLGQICLASAAAGVLCWIVQSALTFGSAGRLLITGCVFGVCYGLIVWKTGLVGHEEKMWIRDVIHRMIRPRGGRALLPRRSHF